MEDGGDSLKKRSLATIQSSNDNPNKSNMKRIRNHPDVSHSISYSTNSTVVSGSFGVVEDMLSVPVNVLFRKLPENGKPLLSRSEASCLVQIHKLAHQIDILTDLSAQIFHHQTQYRTMANSLEKVDHPYLRPLFLLLRISATHHVDTSIERIRNELAHVFHQLDIAANHLARYSEQNYTLADDIQEFSEALAMQKRKLSELQDEVRRRIQTYFLNTIVASTDSTNIPSTNQFSFPPPLQDYCHSLFDESNEMTDLQPDSPTVLSVPQSDITTTKLTKPQPPQNNARDASEASSSESSSTSSVTSPEASPEPEDLTEPDHSQQGSLSNTPQASNLTKKMAPYGNALDEKENTPSQPSSSQNSASQSQPLLDPPLQQQQQQQLYSVDDSFKSQAAAEVLSMLASSSAAATKNTPVCWPPNRTNHGSAVAESPSFL